MENNFFLPPILLKATNVELKMNDFDKIFFEAFKTVNEIEFKSTNESKNFYNTLKQYFFRKNEFYESPCLIIKENTPSLNKGLLIIGNPGVGKSAVLKTFEYIFKDLCVFNKYYSFKMISVSSVVSEFESLEEQFDRKNYYSKMSTAFKCFDDVKSERDASNYGKVNVMKDILFQRYENKSKTIINCNYDDNYPNDYEKALDEFGIKYDGRIYDRLFEMFNIIVVEGKSFRR